MPIAIPVELFWEKGKWSIALLYVAHGFSLDTLISVKVVVSTERMHLKKMRHKKIRQTEYFLVTLQ